MQYGAPIIHDYMCFDQGTMKMEGWDAPVEYQLSAVTGFHAGKGVFLQSEAELDEKDIYRHRIDDSTFEFLGILTEVRNGVVSFPNIWYDTIDVNTIKGEHTERVFTNTKTHLSIEQADSTLSKWGTSRR